MAKLEDLIARDTRANQPTAGIAGRLYCVTDEDNLIERDNGTTWEEYVVPGGGGSLTDTYANIPSPSTDGALFLPSNGYSIYRDTGAAWAPWGPIFPLTKPTLSDFAWVNQESATAVETNGGIHLQYYSGSTGNTKRMRVLKKTAPSPPYTITTAFIPLYDFGTIGYANCGVCFRESSSGKMAVFGFSPDNSYNMSTMWVSKFSSADGHDAHYIYAPRSMIPTQPCWMQMSDDNTNRIFRISYDGINFFPVHSVSRTDYLTANEVGFYISTNGNDSVKIGMTLISWKES